MQIDGCFFFDDAIFSTASSSSSTRVDGTGLKEEAARVKKGYMDMEMEFFFVLILFQIAVEEEEAPPPSGGGGGGVGRPGFR